MRKILVLGHNGMLGNAVARYFTAQGYEVLTASHRWGDPAFEEEMRSTDAEAIINCIGAIPQKKPPVEEYANININLPTFLETLGKKVIHPTTDCEFKGNRPAGEMYTKTDARDADDDYGKSKAIISEKIEKEFKNTKMLRVSIIGHELTNHVSLLDWFLGVEGEVKGYTNHFWNGITTLEWAKLTQDLIEHWDTCPALNQHGTPDLLSKYDILVLAKEVYGKNAVIHPFEAHAGANKCLLPDKPLPPLKTQLEELKAFYGK